MKKRMDNIIKIDKQPKIFEEVDRKTLKRKCKWGDWIKLEGLVLGQKENIISIKITDIEIDGTNEFSGSTSCSDYDIPLKLQIK